MLPIPDWCVWVIADGGTPALKARDHELYVDASEISERTIGPMVNNLGGAIFEIEHPGGYPGLHMEEVRELAGGPPMTPERKAMLKRLRELTYRGGMERGA